MTAQVTLYLLYRADDSEPYQVLQELTLTTGTNVKLISAIEQPHPDQPELALREVEVIGGPDRGKQGWVPQAALEMADPITPRLMSKDNNSINIRAGDSTVFGVVGRLAPGEYALILGVSNRNRDWFKVQLASGEMGWVASGVVVAMGDLRDLPLLIPPPLPQPTATPTEGIIDVTPFPTDSSGQPVEPPQPPQPPSAATNTPTSGGGGGGGEEH